MKVRVTALCLCFVVCGISNVARADRADDIWNGICDVIDAQADADEKIALLEVMAPQAVMRAYYVKQLIGAYAGSTRADSIHLMARLLFVHENGPKVNQLVDEAAFHLFFGELDDAEAKLGEAQQLQSDVQEQMDEAFDYMGSIYDETGRYFADYYIYNMI